MSIGQTSSQDIREHAEQSLAGLTERQRAVLGLMAQGRTNPQIAEEFGISLDGAKHHVSEVLTRLGFASREEAAAWWRHRSGISGMPRRMRRRAPVFIALAAGIGAAGVGIAAVFALAGNGSSPQEPAGQVAVPQLSLHGIYRLVPQGYGGDLPVTTQPLQWEAGVASSDVAVLEASPLFQNLSASLVPGLTLTTFDTHDATSGVIVRQVYTSPDGQQSVEVTRRAVTKRPIDILVPATGASLELQQTSVAGTEAIVFHRSSTSPNPVAFTSIQAVSGGIETLVIVSGLPEPLAFEIIEDVVN